METTATIEVNGKRYDAVTGAVLGPASAPQLRRTGHNIDGFFRPRATAASRHAAVQRQVESSVVKTTTRLPASASAALHTKPTMRDVLRPAKAEAKPHQPLTGRAVNHARAHSPQAAAARNITVSHTVGKAEALTVHRGEPNHVRHHVAQHSRTLRRDAVPTPEFSTHNTLRPQSALQHKVPGFIAFKKSAANVDAERLVRAQTAPKSPLVARHHVAVPTGFAPMFAPLAVQPMPSTPPATPAPNDPNNPGNGGEPVPPPQQGNQPLDMFEAAITRANNFVDIKAHTTRYRQKARLHVASMVGGSLALVIIASFIAYQNSPALQLKVAAYRSGVSTGAPDLATAGFTYNGARAGDGKLTLGLKGPRGTYQLTQTNTNLSDADMIQAVGSTDASGTPVYQTVMAGNTMVYRFNNTNATWVSNGEWYTLSANCPVTDQQIRTIVQHT
ncbi:MAG TPA: hypothetical protein VGM08_01670 [Candidatus Saccharimonadales bacterium]|jgi:hypothetical protein